MFSRPKPVPQITVHQLKKWMESDEEFLLVDVREPDEYAACCIEGSRLIPLRQIAHRVGELDKSVKTVVMCRSGGRSAQAAEFMIACGFTDVVNLQGGILAWSDAIDPSMPKY